MQLVRVRHLRGAGRVRCIGITHYTASSYPEVEAVLRAEKLDFLQINWALNDRAAAERLLPLAQERGVAVLGNRPFAGHHRLSQNGTCGRESGSRNETGLGAWSDGLCASKLTFAQSQ